MSGARSQSSMFKSFYPVVGRVKTERAPNALGSRKCTRVRRLVGSGPSAPPSSFLATARDRQSALMELLTIFVFSHDAWAKVRTARETVSGSPPSGPSRASFCCGRLRPLGRGSLRLCHEAATLADSGVVAATPPGFGSEPICARFRACTRRVCARRRSVRRSGSDPIGPGSKVSLCVQAREKFLAEGIRSRAVSMPSRDIFEHQTREYRDSVLLPQVMACLAVEQASTLGWKRYAGGTGVSPA